MKVNEININNAVLKDLQPGEVFKKDNIVFMRGFYHVHNGFDSCCPCVVLNSGCIMELNSRTKVVKAKLSECTIEF